MNRAPRLNGLAQQNRAHVNSPLVVLIMSDYLVAILSQISVRCYKVVLTRLLLS